MEIKTDNTCKGTRILFDDTADRNCKLIRVCEDIAHNSGFKRVIMPIIQPYSIFEGKVGQENQHMMYEFEDAGHRHLCLAPEYTAVCQDVAKTTFKHHKDVELFYTQECFRAEKPQAGRYRQFTQFGMEVLNPRDSKEALNKLVKLALGIIHDALAPAGHSVVVQHWSDTVARPNLKLNYSAKRGLDYYKNGEGFEITWEGLGAQKQICGGGEYDGGVGFAIGIDRLLII